MVRLRDYLSIRALALVCSIAIAPGDTLYAQVPNQAAAQEHSKLYQPEQLESLIAPIALYPDSLLAQVLAASTYPLQIVAADRWMKQNSKLQSKSLAEAAGQQSWDPSVQALVAFPTVLQMLDQNLEWTTALGNAFLAQEADLMAAAQRLRMKAEQSGKLESNAHQQVQNTTVDGQPTITIQPADPQVIYVPTYESAAVYGAAPEYYPYPSLYYPPGYVVGSGLISFGLGVAVGAIFNNGWGWGWGCNWGARPSLYVNNNFFAHNRNNFVNRGNWGNEYRGNGNMRWNHNPVNRGSLPYANRDVANRFNGGRPGNLRPSQLPANTGNIRAPGGGNRPGAAGLPGNIGSGRGLGGGGRAGLAPPNPASRPGGSGGRTAQLPANRGAGFRGGGGFNRGGGYRGGSRGFRGGGGSRGGGRRR